MHLLHIPQCSIQNRNVHISVLNETLWEMELVHSGICEIGLLFRLHTERDIQILMIAKWPPVQYCLNGLRVDYFLTPPVVDK